jgi:hypothetical protein
LQAHPWQDADFELSLAEDDSDFSFLLTLRPTLSKPIKAGVESCLTIFVPQSSQSTVIFPISLIEC